MRRHLEAFGLAGPALAVFCVFLLVPIGFVLALSFHTYALSTGIRDDVWTLANYFSIATDGYFYSVFLRTLRISVAVTALACVLGTLEAYVLSRMRQPWRGVFLLVALGPLLISIVARTLGWALLLGSTGLVNQALLAVGAIGRPIRFMYTETGVVIALTHVLVPYMVIAVWTSLQKIDPRVEDAAVSLGASSMTVIRRVVVPQAIPGILSGGIIVFSLAASAFATPAIIGGRRLKVVPTVAYDEFLYTLDWPLGAAIALLLLVFTVILAVLVSRYAERRYTAAF
ncbi:MAG: ABC transporter permease [Acetobacteraceae bacterium]